MRRPLVRRHCALRGCRTLLGLAAAAAVVLAAGGCGGPSSPAPPPTVDVSVSHCGNGWSATRSGLQHLVLHSSDSRPGEAQLIDPGSGRVYVDVEPIGPGTTANVDVTLNPGTYAIRCLMEDEPQITGSPVRLTGATSADAAPGVAPVTQADLVPATLAYQKYVTSQLGPLVRLTTAVQTALQHGDLAGARAAWLPAHLKYEQLGAAYGAFGDADDEINGLPNGLPRGTVDPGWTGFHRIEYGLWHGERATSLLPHAKALVAAETKLRTSFGNERIDPLEMAIRAHEITENALQFELTGETDFGSHSNLATIGANLTGTRVVLDALHTVLAPRFPRLATLEAGVATAQTLVSGLHDRPLSTLTRTERERVDASISSLSEELAPVASILEPRRTQ